MLPLTLRLSRVTEFFPEDSRVRPASAIRFAVTRVTAASLASADSHMTSASSGTAQDAVSVQHRPQTGTPSYLVSVECRSSAFEDRAALQRLPEPRVAPAESVAQCPLHTVIRRQACGRELPRRTPKRKSWNFPSRSMLPRPDARQLGRGQCPLRELQPEHNRQRATRRWSQRRRQAMLTKTSQTEEEKQRWYPHLSRTVLDLRAVLQHLPGDLDLEELKPVPRLTPGPRSGRRTTSEGP